MYIDAIFTLIATASEPLGLAYSPHVVALEGGGSVGEYFTTVHVGNPPLPFRVQIDTGSSTLFVASKGCVACTEHATQLYDVDASTTGERIGCSDSRCRANTCGASNCPSGPAAASCNPFLNPEQKCCSDVVTADCGYAVKYAGGSQVGGALVADDVRLGTLNANVTFGRTLEQGGPWHGTVDGIFGMAMAALDCTPTCTTPLMADLVAQNGLDDAFSMCLSEAGGWLVVGGVDDQFRSGPFVTVPMVKSASDAYLYYRVAFTGLAVGQHGINMVPSTTSGGAANPNAGAQNTAIVDSGTTLLLLPGTLFDELVGTFVAHFAHLDGVLGTSTRASVLSKLGGGGGQPCLHSPPDPTEWPLIRMQLGPGLQIELPAYLYFSRVGGGAALSSAMWCFGIQPLEGTTQGIAETILGDTVLRGFYVAYDRQKELIGFAPVNEATCGLPGAGGVNGPPAPRDAAIAFLEPLGPYAALVVGTLVGVLIATLHLVLANPHILGDAAALEEESADGDGSERERDFAGAAGDDGGDGIELSQRVDRGGGTLSYPVATTFVVTEEEAGAGGGSASGVAAPGPDDGGTIPWGDVDEDDGDDGFGEFAEAPPPPRAQGATAFLD